MLALIRHAIEKRFNVTHPRGQPDQKRARGRTPHSPFKSKVGMTQFDGGMSQTQRVQAIQAFHQDPSIRILLISLK
jgi:hypothetical protein